MVNILREQLNMARVYKPRNNNQLPPLAMVNTLSKLLLEKEFSVSHPLKPEEVLLEAV
jgi:hypothetical protein